MSMIDQREVNVTKKPDPKGDGILRIFYFVPSADVLRVSSI